MKKSYLIFLSIFALASFLFFFWAERYHTLDRESMQLFLYTEDFFRETVLCKGGLCNYLSAFLIQFFHFPILGGAIISLFLVLLEYGIYIISDNKSFFPLTFIPSIIYFVLLCDNNYTFNGLVALTAAVFLFAAIMKIRKCRGRIVVSIISIPLFYYLFAGRFFLYQEAPEWVFVSVWGATALIVAVCFLLNKIRISPLWAIISSALIFSLGAICILSKYDRLDEEIYKYTFLAREKQWRKIINDASEKPLLSPVSTNALNLALAMTDQMGDKMFSFFQKGERSLINFQERKVSAEILFNLGFINEAQHLTFEDMASNPDLQRGAFHIVRLAETNMIAGRMNLAHKYLKTLEHTLFYRKWAKKTLKISDNEVCSHNYYGKLRKMQPYSDFRFDNSSFEKMLEIMIAQHPDNALAQNYLLASYLLNKNLDAFYTHTQGMVRPLPRHYDEALVMIDALKGGKAVSGELQNYVNAYNLNRGNRDKLLKYSGTYWFYYNYR